MRLQPKATKQNTKRYLAFLLVEADGVGLNLSELTEKSGYSKGYVSRIMREVWRDYNEVHRVESEYRKNVRSVRYYWSKS